MEEQFHCRTVAEYNYHALLLTGPFSTHDSTTYGLNYPSPLNEVKFFHVCNGQLPQDIMHTLMEGVLLKEIQVMLERFIYVNHLFTLETFNDRLAFLVMAGLKLKPNPLRLLRSIM